MATRKLLLADDSVTIQKVVNLTFADEGIEVITVGDGDAAMRKFNESTPDLVMVDVNMPGLNGYRICETIKQSDETKHIPVILLVGSFEPFDEEEARRVKADDFLTKPFQSIRLLVNKVSDLLVGDESAESENEISAAVDFDNTLEVPSPDEQADSTENLGDAGMDDEMIQTSQIGSLPTDEARKFEFDSEYRSSAEDDDFAALKQPYNFDNSNESAAPDWTETQPVLKDESNDSGNDSPQTPNYEEVYELADEEDLNEEFEQILARNKNVNLTPDDASGFALDDFNLLELPQSKKDSSSKFEPQNKSKNSSETTVRLRPEATVEQAQTAYDEAQSNNLSTEMIEAIADKIVEKISDQLIRKVVKEAVAQLAKKK